MYAKRYCYEHKEVELVAGYCKECIKGINRLIARAKGVDIDNPSSPVAASLLERSII